MVIDSSTLVTEIVRSNYRTADVFKKWGINYCCGGNLPLADICRMQQIDVDAVAADLQKATHTIAISNQLSFQDWSIPFLVDYILHVHHAYLKATLPALQKLILPFVKSHKRKHGYLENIECAFITLSETLHEQLQGEEETIFPYCKQIYSIHERNEAYGGLFVRTLGKPLGALLHNEQTPVARLLDVLRVETNGYTFAADACTNHQVIYHKLKELDADLVQHKHLENNILFPRVLQMEKALRQL
jgi:regulator of cell morphogenesis and NO signaling